MTARVAPFYGFMEQYAGFMDDMAAAEDQKYQALISNDLDRMDRAIAESQALLMRLGKLESRREQCQRDAGWGGLVFREIIDRLEGGDRDDFMRLFDRISRTVALVQQSNRKAMAYADMRLYINDRLPREAPDDVLYTADGVKTGKSEENQAGSVFQTKI